MKNIQKIADEIFQAPSEEELFERAMQKEPRTQNELIEDFENFQLRVGQLYLPFPEKTDIIDLFPKGALVFNKSIDRAAFKLIEKNIDDKSRQLLGTTSGFEWYKSKLKDRNVNVVTVLCRSYLGLGTILVEVK
jgi:hypothetical protein